MTKPEDSIARNALLYAGAGMINSNDHVEALTVDALVKAAKLKKKDFTASFRTRPAYLRALLLYLFDETRVEVLNAGRSAPKPGQERVWKCTEAFLDSNLKHRGLRTLVFALAGDPIATEIVRRRTNGYSMLFKLEFDAMAVPHAAARGRFCAVMTQEAAAAEHEARKPLSDIRTALYSFIRSL